MTTVNHFVEHFLQPLGPGEPPPPIEFDESRGLNVLPDGRALVDVELEGGTVTGTKAGGEQDDSDRDREPSTVTFVQSEGVDHTAEGALARAGTVTLTEANSEATDTDDDISQLLVSPAGRRASTGGAIGLLGTTTETAVELERSDVD